MNKYFVQAIGNRDQEYYLYKNRDRAEGGAVIIARFYSSIHEVAATNAQKVCDLLNEVSRSQGKF